MSLSRDPEDVRQRLAKRYRALEESRHVRPIAALASRFKEIDGGIQGTLVSAQLFTTVIPLTIIGFSYLSGFADNASPGTIFIRQFALAHPLSDRVRDAFGHSSGLRADWTLLGVAGFLIWGIPMSITVASFFAKAWRREPFSIMDRLWRGTAWFALYLAVIAIRERIAFGGHHAHAMRPFLVVAALAPVWLFWSLTPVLLVRDGARGMSHLALAGLAGVVIDGLAIPLLSRLFFPSLLADWDDFGPIGVAMALFIWCGAVGTGWVLTACVGALLWERSAPARTVVDSQSPKLAV